MFKSLTGVPDSFDTVLRVNNTPAKKVNHKKIFKKAGDVKDEMLHSFRNGKKHGLTTHSEVVDKVFTWMPGFLCCITGWPQMGKSELILFLSLLRAKKSGDKFVIYPPESGKADQFFDQLVHAYLGENIDPYYTNRVSESDYLRAIDFVHEHFFFIDEEEINKQDLDSTPELIRELAEWKHAEEPYFAIIKDPWNQLTHNYQNRDDIYLSNQLKQEKLLAVKLNIINLILAHPKEYQGLYDPNIGLPVPMARNLAGGAMWNNKCDLIASVHRPNYHKDPKDCDAVFVTQKIKMQRYVAYPGTVNLRFIPAKNRYFINGNDVLSDIGLQKEYSYYEISKLPNSTEFEQENPPF